MYDLGVKSQIIDFWNYSFGVHMGKKTYIFSDTEDKKTNVPVQQEDMFPCPRTRNVFYIMDKETYLLAHPEGTQEAPSRYSGGYPGGQRHLAVKLRLRPHFL
jgi:hypothetical protein